MAGAGHRQIRDHAPGGAGRGACRIWLVSCLGLVDFALAGHRRYQLLAACAAAIDRHSVDPGVLLGAGGGVGTPAGPRHRGEARLAAAVPGPLRVGAWPYRHRLPRNAPGYLFSANLPLLQSASLVGLYGLTLLALAVGFAPAFWIAGHRKPAICFAVLLPVLAAYGWNRLAETPPPPPEPSKLVRLVQPAVPQHEKWDLSLRPSHLERLQSLSRDETPVPRLVIWPETAFAGLLNREPDMLQAAAWEALPFDGWLITGVPRFDAQKRLFNSAVLMRADGTIEAIYDKRRLVPFGEFVPLRDFLPFADAIAGPIDFSAGAGEQRLALPHMA